MIITQNLPKGMSQAEREKRIRTRRNALRIILRKHKAANNAVLAALKKARQDAIAKARKKHPDFNADIKKFQAKAKQRRI